MEVKQTKFILKGLFFNFEIFLIEINYLIDGVHEARLEINKKTTFVKVISKLIICKFKLIFHKKKTNRAD